MVFRRQAPSGVEPAHRALAQGRYEVAFALLESAARRQRDLADQARLRLYLAAAYALYGHDGLEGGLRCLRDAVMLEPRIAEDPLYRALYWELGAYRGDAKADVRRGALAAARSDDGVASYHAASALLIVGANKRAKMILERLSDEVLPDYLQWRRWSLLGQAREQLGEFEAAAEAYQQAVEKSRGLDQQGERLNLAACWVEAGKAHEALEVLAEVKSDELDELEQATHAYLEGRAHALLANPNEALQRFLRARVLEDAAGEPSFGLRLALAQLYATLGKRERALESYHEALALAPKAQRSLALHEYAFALFENEQLLEARETLLEVVEDERYAYRADVYADLAELEFRLGNFEAADDLARRALDLGAVAAACLCLGTLALEYCRFDEAIGWFEQAASASREGDTDWLAAQELLADTLVQAGLKQPARVLHHAEAALRYLADSDEWTVTLRDYVARAKAALGGRDRLLN